jgi:hypothetical protein
MKNKWQSIAITPTGRVYTKVSSIGYEYVLISSKGCELNKWSNSKETLEKEIRFLVKKCNWKKEELLILGTDINPSF